MIKQNSIVETGLQTLHCRAAVVMCLVNIFGASVGVRLRGAATGARVVPPWFMAPPSSFGCIRSYRNASRHSSQPWWGVWLYDNSDSGRMFAYDTSPRCRGTRLGIWALVGGQSWIWLSKFIKNVQVGLCRKDTQLFWCCTTKWRLITQHSENVKNKTDSVVVVTTIR